MESLLFTPYQLGPITLRNRTIRSAAFENMCYGNRPSQDLFNYHTSVAKGGIGMTTIAYAAVNRSGVSFNGQLWMREEIIPELKTLTDAIHADLCTILVIIEVRPCTSMVPTEFRKIVTIFVLLDWNTTTIV